MTTPAEMKWTALLALVLLTQTSCASLAKHTSERYKPPAGCSERAIALRPPPPPKTTNWVEWATAYVGALGAFEDSENKRAETASCLEKQP